MKKIMLSMTVFIFFLLFFQTAEVSVASSNNALDVMNVYTSELMPGFRAATELSRATGIAFSPLLGILVRGAPEYLNHKDSDGPLPFHASPRFLIPVLLLIILIGMKDSIGEILGPLKKPLDIIDGAQNILAGLTGAIIIIPHLVSLVEPFTRDTVVFLWNNLLASNAYASQDIVKNGLQIGALQIVATLLAISFSLVMYSVVWIASNAINVLLILNPFPFVGMFLKSIRVSIVIFLSLTTSIHLFFGLAVSILLIITCYIICKWSFNLTIFGWVVIKDFMLGTWRNTQVDEQADIKLFSTGNLPKTPGRSYGKLTRVGNQFVFSYRPWLIFSVKSVLVPIHPSMIRIGKSLIFNQVIEIKDRCESYLSYFLVPPKYNRHEIEIMKKLGFPHEICEIGLRKGIKAAIQWLKNEFFQKK